jgi:hypothetical protein
MNNTVEMKRVKDTQNEIQGTDEARNTKRKSVDVSANTRKGYWQDSPHSDFIGIFNE